MRTFKKALSVFLCAVLMFTTMCFFPLNVGVDASAAVVNTGNRTAFYVPETIYLYPEVSSWKNTSKTPFQYYVGNTVDTENIYAAPTVNADTADVGKIYFAAEEGMSDVALTVKYIDLLGNYMEESKYGSVSFTSENKGDYYEFTVTDGMSPELQASETGAYIEWCITYKNPEGEKKAVFNYTYIYKPYVVPYGAATRVVNEKDDVNVFGQHITWVSGVHSADNTAAQTNTLYPRYIPVSEAVVSTDNTRGEYPFSPFLSKDNKAYVNGTEVTGAAPVANGGYNAVFAGTDADNAYFWANQSGATFARSYRVREFFYTAQTDVTYPVAFDYMYPDAVSTQYALSQVTPTRIGTITVDISRYSNLKDIPNLAVGMMSTDTDIDDAVAGNPDEADAQWYIGDATGRSHLATGTYSSVNDINNAQRAIGVKFASGTDLTAPLAKGIWYAGAWNKELTSGTGLKTYTVKSYYEAEDREGDRQAASSAVNLNVNQVDKTYLRSAVNEAVSYLGALGIKENWNSYYYDINYIDPDTNASAWSRFRAAYINACGALGNVNTDLPLTYDEYASELEASLDALRSGKGLRVYFDVNHDDIGINLWINPNTTYYLWNAEDETAVINGNFYADSQYGVTAFTPDAGAYTLSTTQVSGTFNGNGCSVLEPVDMNRANALNSAGKRYNFDFKGTTTKVFNYEEANFINIEGLKFWSWYNKDAGDSIYNNFTFRIKVEKGDKATAYSPVGKVTGATYGTLPAPEREGYLFAGWCTDETLATVVDASSAVSARILYAKWEKAQYNVVFDGNGATGGTMAEQTFLYDEQGTLNANAYERTGYVFAGWKDAEGNSYADTGSVFNLTSEHQGKYTLYAQWTPNQYSVSFDGNTGLGGLGVMNAVYDTPFDLPANYFIKTGYTFAGWALTSDGDVLYTDTEKVSNLTSDVDGSVTLYAVWTPNEFIVKFDANTGTGSMADAVVAYDSGAELPVCGFTKTGYTFTGWSLTADGTTLITKEEYDNLRTENGDEVTLYAVWSENTYTLSFDKNGGTGENIPATPHGYDESFVIAKNIFSKTGYILAGWSLEKGGALVYENGATVKNICPDNNGKVTLYAVWTPVSYTVKFNANGAEGTMADMTLSYDTEAVLTANAFTKEGYHLKGWATAANGNVVYTDKQNVKNITAEDGKVITLYAVWEINTYTVKFSYINNQGVRVTTNVNVKHGETAMVPSDFTTTPYMDTASHYVFSKWDKDITNVTSDMTVSALYPANSVTAHSMKSDFTPSTCKVYGQTVYYCENCSYRYTVPETSLKAHSFDGGKVDVEPGCVTPGSMVYTCEVCGDTKAESIEPTKHSFVNFPAKEPTCSEEGNIAHKHCEKCEQCFASGALITAPDSEALTDEQVKIAKLPHTEGAEATCTTPKICTVCNEVLVAALGHKEVIEYITADATCTVSGTYNEKVTCSVCNEIVRKETKTGTIPHSYTEKVTAPTCTDEGYTTFTCTVCGDTYKDNYVDANGHTEGAWRVTTAATCTDTGIETNKCSVCNADWKTRSIAAEGHDSGKWTVTTAATCEGWGTESLICTKCNTAITTRGIAPKGHGETKTEVTVEPGCESAGRMSVICVDCGAELSFSVIPETGHKPDGTASCEKDSVCTVCKTVLASHFGHKWDGGIVTKEPTEEEEGIRTFTCANDSSHTYTEAIPVRVVIELPEIPADGTYDLDADENGKAGNIYNIVFAETGMTFTASSSDESIVRFDSNGNIIVTADGEAVITIKTTDGKHEKSFRVTARTLKTVTFDVRGTLTSIKAYAGDTVTGPEVESYTDENGFWHKFRAWAVNGAAVSELVVTGDMTFVATYSSACDYTEFDRLAALFEDVISGSFDNENELNIYQAEIKNAQDIIAEFTASRDERDDSKQDMVDAAALMISAVIAKLYPEEASTLEIRGIPAQCNAGSSYTAKAFVLPLDVETSAVVWESSDPATGFISGGRFYAVKTGTVTITASTGNISTTFEVNITGITGARVLMFDTLISNVNFIVEGSYIIKETTNIFWAPDAPVSFRVIDDGTFEEYVVYINDKVATPDINGVYTIPANTGDAHIRADGLVNDFDQDGTKHSFWDTIREFFNKIAEFFRNLFGMG